VSEQAPLLSISEAPAPADGAAEWFDGAGGAPLRAALFSPKGAPKGSVVVSPGRTEPIEKYYEVVADLQARGFVVLVHDWRGQGLSHRELADRSKGHARGFKTFLADYGLLLDHFADRLPKPWIALGHSMGGCLTLLALAHGEDRFAACALSAPMLGLHTGGRSPLLGRAWAWWMVHTGRAGHYLFGDAPDPLAYDFEDSRLTHDKARYDRYHAQILACPDLALGGLTWGWLDFAFSACAWLQAAPAVSRVAMPVVVVGAGDDSRVVNRDLKAVTARLPHGRYVEIAGAYHELLVETDPVRSAFWREFDALTGPVISPNA